MDEAPVQVPVRDSVGAALRFARERWRRILPYAAGGALAVAALAGLQLILPAFGLVGPIVSTMVQAAVYAAFLLAVLEKPKEALGAHAFRVWAAMAAIAFFLFIVLFVVTIPVSFALFIGPMAPYAGDLQAAGQDSAAVTAVTMRFVEEQPGAVLAVMLFYGAIWMALTSRLYLAAPATVSAGRILSFETWKWTKGAMLRIAAARLMLLGPAYVLVSALGMLIGRLFGADAFDPFSVAALAQANPTAFLIYAAVNSFLTFALYWPLEAGLSAYLYRGLKPAGAATS